MENEFLLDEVRNGFWIPAVMKQAWAADIEVLMEIDRVCKKHNIQYFADWGTLLGAVRHGGFIPWDDDLDIVMKREDYNKFMTVARFDMEEGFDVQSFYTEKDYWLFMAKVVGRNHICFEKEHLRRFHNFPYIASVDIFVLDYVHRDAEEEEKRRVLCKYMLGVANDIIEGKVTPYEKEKSLQILEDMYGKKLPRIAEPSEMGKYLYGEIEKIFAQVHKEDADKLTQLFPGGLKGSAFQFPKEYYENSIDLPFEYFRIPVPAAYDKMLRMRYGDYIRLVKDAGAHNYPFFEGQKENLLKVLDFSLNEFRFDIGKLFRGETEAQSKSNSYKMLVSEAFGEIERLQDSILKLLEGDEKETLAECLEASQQLSVDVGDLLEEMLGEDNEIMPLLVQYCEILYMIFEYSNGEGSLSSVSHQQNKEEGRMLAERLKMQGVIVGEVLQKRVFDRKTVLFLSVLSKDWSGLNQMWEKATKDPDCDVIVMPLPYYYKDYDGAPKEILCDLEDFPDYVQVLDYQAVTAEYLELLHPEVIITQNAYDNWHPNLSVAPMFYTEQLRKYTDRLVYVQPQLVDEFTKADARAYNNQRYYLNMPGVVYADSIIVQSANIKKQCIEMLVEFAGEDTRNVWEERVAYIDDICDDSVTKKETVPHRGKQQYKQMLYGISLGLLCEEEELVKRKIRSNLELFANYDKKLQVDICVFPDDERAIELKMWLGNEVRELLNVNMVDLREHDLREYDAYYGDVMPIVLEFKETGKPVMMQNVFL